MPVSQPDLIPILAQRVAEQPANLALRVDFAVALEAEGRLAEAAEQLRHAAELPGVTVNICVAWARMATAIGQHDGALLAYKKAHAIEPANLAVAKELLLLSDVPAERAQTAAIIQTALNRDPGDIQGWIVLSRAAAGGGDFQRATEILDLGIAKTGAPALRLYRAQMFPKLPASRDEIDQRRNAAKGLLHGLIAEQPRSIVDPMRDVNRLSIHTVYHHQNAREMQDLYARAHLAAAPGLEWHAPTRRSAPRKRPRIGVISRFWDGDHVVERSLRTVFRSEIDSVETLFLHTKPAPRARAPGSNLIEVPLNLHRARALIADLELDLLLYPELGSDPFTYYLSFSRLAPIQAAMPGFGMTTGVGNVDYFLTGRDWEIAGDISGHYTERPVRLDFPPYYFTPESVQPDVSVRAMLGELPAAANIYLCLHTIYKYHPDLDGMIARILALDPLAHVVILHNAGDPWWNVLWRRLDVLGENAKRILAVPRLARSQFLGLISTADVILDAPHHSCGTTAYEALHLGTPIVTKPSEFMRGRMTSGLYKILDVPELVAESAEDYAQTAVRIATDKTLRNDISRRVLAAREQIVGTQDRAKSFMDALVRLSHGE